MPIWNWQSTNKEIRGCLQQRASQRNIETRKSQACRVIRKKFKHQEEILNGQLMTSKTRSNLVKFEDWPLIALRSYSEMLYLFLLSSLWNINCIKHELYWSVRKKLFICQNAYSLMLRLTLLIFKIHPEMARHTNSSIKKITTGSLNTS